MLYYIIVCYSYIKYNNCRPFSSIGTAPPKGVPPPGREIKSVRRRVRRAVRTNTTLSNAPKGNGTGAEGS